MNLHVACITHTGPVRKNNEDSLLVMADIVNRTSMTEPLVIQADKLPAWFIVADGIGGEEAGEEASGQVVSYLRDAFSSPEHERPDCSDLRSLLDGAKKTLDARATGLDHRLGTTLSGLWLDGSNGAVFNVGDCRVYKVTGGFLNRITRDHSLLEVAGNSEIKVSSSVVPRFCKSKSFFREIQP